MWVKVRYRNIDWMEVKVKDVVRISHSFEPIHEVNGHLLITLVYLEEHRFLNEIGFCVTKNGTASEPHHSKPPVYTRNYKGQANKISHESPVLLLLPETEEEEKEIETEEDDFTMLGEKKKEDGIEKDKAGQGKTTRLKGGG